MHQLKRSNQQSHYQNLINDYASLPPEPRAHRDLKKFPLQTYSSSKHLGSHEKGQDVTDSNARPSLRHQVSERIISKSKSENKENTASDLHHSKSVPNLANNNHQQSQHTNGSGDHSSGDIDHDLTSDPANFSYLDPEKRLRVTDNTLKLIQKQALLDYYERHNTLRRPGLSSHVNGKFPSSVNDLDSGFYSPTEPKVNGETTLTNVAEVDHHVPPSQSQGDASDTKVRPQTIFPYTFTSFLPSFDPVDWYEALATTTSSSYGIPLLQFFLGQPTAETHIHCSYMSFGQAAVSNVRSPPLNNSWNFSSLCLWASKNSESE